MKRIVKVKLTRTHDMMWIMGCFVVGCLTTNGWQAIFCFCGMVFYGVCAVFEKDEVVIEED